MILFHYEYGLMNQIVRALGGESISWFLEPKYWRTIIPAFSVWKTMGYTSLIYYGTIMGIDTQIFESAEIDGATTFGKIWHITLPLLKPILVYVLITSAIGGLQMYDIPALFNVSKAGLIGNPDDKTTTMAMYIMRLYSSDVGKAAAVSVFLFIVTLIISLLFFASMKSGDTQYEKKARKKGARG